MEHSEHIPLWDWCEPKPKKKKGSCLHEDKNGDCTECEIKIKSFSTRKIKGEKEE